MNENNDLRNVFFTFMLGDVLYAIDVRSIKEVLTYEAITPVPRTEKYMKGVMNIRGAVISIIDLHILFNIPAVTDEESTSIVVTEVTLEGDTPFSFGFIADSVNGVTTLDAELPKNHVESGLSVVNSEFITALGRTGDQFVLILDMEQILQHLEKDLAEQAKIK